MLPLVGSSERIDDGAPRCPAQAWLPPGTLYIVGPFSAQLPQSHAGSPSFSDSCKGMEEVQWPGDNILR